MLRSLIVSRVFSLILSTAYLLPITCTSHSSWHIGPSQSSSTLPYQPSSPRLIPCPPPCLASLLLHRPSSCRFWPSPLPLSIWFPGHCYVAVISSILPQHMANHLPSPFLDLFAQFLHVWSLEYLLIADVVLPINLQDSPQTFMLETIHCLVIFLSHLPPSLASVQKNRQYYNALYNFIFIFFELHILPSLVHAPLSFDSLLLRSFISPPSLQTFAPKYVNSLTSSIS